MPYIHGSWPEIQTPAVLTTENDEWYSSQQALLLSPIIFQSVIGCSWLLQDADRLQHWTSFISWLCYILWRRCPAILLLLGALSVSQHNLGTPVDFNQSPGIVWFLKHHSLFSHSPQVSLPTMSQDYPSCRVNGSWEKPLMDVPQCFRLPR